jgi:hypothetical protein
VCEDAELVTNELIANVVDHAGTRCTLDVSVTDQGLLIEVRDFYPCPPPQLRPVNPRGRRGADCRWWRRCRHAGGDPIPRREVRVGAVAEGVTDGGAARSLSRDHLDHMAAVTSRPRRRTRHGVDESRDGRTDC